MTPLRLLVLGASGGCGNHVAREGVLRGHDVTVLVRPTTSYEAPTGARVLEDDVLRDGALEAAIEAGATIVSCLGIRRANPKNPWSGLVSPSGFCTPRRDARRACVERASSASLTGPG